MILCLDVGNSQLVGGVFVGDALQLIFRHETDETISSDQLGLFLRNVLRENKITKTIKQIAVSSVVPSMDYSVRSACIKYFDIDPFVIKPGIKTGLKLKIQNPQELGADLVATAIAGVKQYPNRDLIIVDCGTANTVSAISRNSEFLGCVIQPGIRASMLSLTQSASNLPTVQLDEPVSVVGRNTITAIQSGLYYGHLGALKELIARISQEVFSAEKPLILATGGFSGLFEGQQLFDEIIPDLLLRGLLLALQHNGESSK